MSTLIDKLKGLLGRARSNNKEAEVARSPKPAKESSPVPTPSPKAVEAAKPKSSMAQPSQAQVAANAEAIRAANKQKLLDAMIREKNGEVGAMEKAMMNLEPVPTRIGADGKPTTAYVESPGERDAIAPGSISLPRPRAWHYVCAHKFLPGNLSSMGYGFVQMLMREQLDYLERHWASQQFKVGPGHDHIPATGLGTFPFKLSDGRYGLVIRMTPPMAMAEAFFTAVVAFPGDSRAPRYITLELTGVEFGSTETVLCEWRDGTHLNFGGGCEPTVNAFLKEVDRLTQ